MRTPASAYSSDAGIAAPEHWWPKYHHDPAGDQLVGRCDRLLAITVVIDRDQLDALAEHATVTVQIGDRDFGAFPGFSSGPGLIPGQRRREPDPDLGVGRQGA
jgi:hypothetical protein